MSFFDLFAKVRRYNDNATVIFDHAEPIGRATDLVLPGRRWFGRRDRKFISRQLKSATTAKHS
jgi:hypothetical protein